MNQQETRIRNHQILRLRGIWAVAKIMDPDLQETIQTTVDEQLKRWGALTTEEQRKKLLLHFVEGA